MFAVCCYVITTITHALSTQTPDNECYRIRKKILIENEETDLGYITTMWREIEQQKKRPQDQTINCNSNTGILGKDES